MNLAGCSANLGVSPGSATHLTTQDLWVVPVGTLVSELWSRDGRGRGLKTLSS